MAVAADIDLMSGAFGGGAQWACLAMHHEEKHTGGGRES